MRRTSGRSLAMLTAAMALWGTIGVFRRAIPPVLRTGGLF